MKGNKVHMNFHENWPAGSEESMVIQHYRVLTVVMFCVHFFFINRKQTKKSTFIRSVSLTRDFNSYLSEILGLIVFCLITLKTIIFNINCAGHEVCLIFLYSFS